MVNGGRRMSGSPITGPVGVEDVQVALDVARELGPGAERAVVDDFLTRVGQGIDARVDDRLARQRLQQPAEAAAERNRLVLALASLVAGIPVSAIALGASTGAHSGLTGVVSMVIGWSGIAAVNCAHRRHRS